MRGQMRRALRTSARVSLKCFSHRASKRKISFVATCQKCGVTYAVNPDVIILAEMLNRSLGHGSLNVLECKKHQ